MAAATASRRATMLENLMYPINKEGGHNSQDVALAARRQRALFAMSPLERETNRMSRTGRQLAELDILQEKHEPEFRQLVPAVADALLAVVTQQSQQCADMHPDPYYAIYDTSNLPAIEMDAYVHRIAEYTYISPSTMLSSLILMDRLLRRHPKLYLTLRNVYKLFFVATRVASKVVDLRSLNNKNFANIGGISNRNLNELEAHFLVDMHFDFFLSPGEFQQYAQRLQPRSAALPRNYLSRLPQIDASHGAPPPSQINAGIGNGHSVAARHRSTILQAQQQQQQQPPPQPPQALPQPPRRTASSHLLANPNVPPDAEGSSRSLSSASNLSQKKEGGK